MACAARETVASVCEIGIVVGQLSPARMERESSTRWLLPRVWLQPQCTPPSLMMRHAAARLDRPCSPISEGIPCPLRKLAGCRGRSSVIPADRKSFKPTRTRISRLFLVLYRDRKYRARLLGNTVRAPAGALKEARGRSSSPNDLTGRRAHLQARAARYRAGNRPKGIPRLFHRNQGVRRSATLSSVTGYDGRGVNRGRWGRGLGKWPSSSPDHSARRRWSRCACRGLGDEGTVAATTRRSTSIRLDLIFVWGGSLDGESASFITARRGAPCPSASVCSTSRAWMSFA